MNKFVLQGFCGQNFKKRKYTADDLCSVESVVLNFNILFDDLVGYSGTLCEILDPSSVCYNNPCHYGGICYNTVSLKDYACICPVGYRGMLLYRNFWWEHHTVQRYKRNFL
jgi:hypothetical protein